MIPEICFFQHHSLINALLLVFILHFIQIISAWTRARINFDVDYKFYILIDKKKSVYLPVIILKSINLFELDVKNIKTKNKITVQIC